MSSSELVPARAVALLYRRYLKAAVRVPNVTIRHLLVQQVRGNFRRHQGVKSPSAQRELLQQAHNDLMILEDERHARTLYINKSGAVSCLEWEMRRNEFQFTPRGNMVYQIFFAMAFAFFTHLVMNIQSVEKGEPEIAKTVDMMAARLEVDDPAQLPILRAKQQQRMVDDLARMDDLERRILSTFQDVPADIRVPLPNPIRPTPSRRADGTIIAPPSKAGIA